MLSRETTNINVIVFGLTGLEPTMSNGYFGADTSHANGRKFCDQV
jgi:hypothetical protein